MKELLQANSSRVFLKKILEQQYKKRGGTNLSDFSRRAGFSSRSYLSEFLSGKKGLSLDALVKIKQGLKAPRLYSQLFELLAFQDNPSLRPRRYSVDDVRARIVEIKGRLGADALQEPAVKNVAKLVRKSFVFKIFAALGKVGVGATIAEVAARTRLPLPVIEEALRVLVGENTVQKIDDRFLPVNSTFDFLGLTEADGILELTRETSSNIHRNAKKILQEPHNLMLYTAFSIDKKNLAKFKTRLREAAYSIIDEFQKEDGDTVHTVFLTTGE